MDNDGALSVSDLPKNKGQLGGRKPRGPYRKLTMDDAAELLDKATILALRVCIDVMAHDVPRRHRQYVRHQKVRVTAAAIILNTAVRVDEQRMRKKIADRWPALAKLLLEEEKRQKRLDAPAIDAEVVEVAEG